MYSFAYDILWILHHMFIFKWYMLTTIYDINVWISMHDSRLPRSPIMVFIEHLTHIIFDTMWWHYECPNACQLVMHSLYAQLCHVPWYDNKSLYTLAWSMLAWLVTPCIITIWAITWAILHRYKNYNEPWMHKYTCTWVQWYVNILVHWCINTWLHMSTRVNSVQLFVIALS
jgi:hypothetical protein